MMDGVRERLEALAEWLPVIEEPGFDFGHWEGGDKRPDGSITMPYFSFSSQALDFLRTLPVVVFDWPAWAATDEGQALLNDRSRIVAATPDELAKLSTALVRGDRFSEGTLASAFESGLLTAIARRADALLKEAPEESG